MLSSYAMGPPLSPRKDGESLAFIKEVRSSVTYICVTFTVGRLCLHVLHINSPRWPKMLFAPYYLIF
jgi:hypothetical protein